MPAKPAIVASTQKYLNILAIRDGMVILHDGGIRMILEVGSLNFALKSEEEQNGMLYQYQQFLNSLKFPLQIVMQSRRLDLFSYLKMLRELLEKQTNDLIRIQTEEYTNYIERLLTKANIMDKKFFVVIPYFPGGIEKSTMIDKVFGAASKTNEVHFTKEKFLEYKEKLNERVNVISSGLGSMGLRVNSLNTQQTIELLYSIYNPAEAMSERMTEVSNLESPIVKTDLPVQMIINNDPVLAETIVATSNPQDQIITTATLPIIENISNTTYIDPMDVNFNSGPTPLPVLNDISIPINQENFGDTQVYPIAQEYQNNLPTQQSINIPVAFDNIQAIPNNSSYSQGNEAPAVQNNLPSNNSEGQEYNGSL